MNCCPFPNCNESWYDGYGWLRKNFQWLPIILHPIALFFSKATTKKLAYQHMYCQMGSPEDVTDIFNGALYQKLCEGEVTINDKKYSH